MPCHLRGEKYHRDKSEKIDEKVDEIRYERDVVMKDHLIKRGVVFDEAVDIFGNVEHYHHDNEKTDGKEKSANELSENIPVYLSHHIQYQSVMKYDSSLSGASCRATP